MRIIGVQFKNLNSLAGEWQVNFSGPEYVSDGIFAITGPTGAGKTTILDAICLGLYGRTPRLEKVTKNSNEIMSRQTGDCFAEVTFETQKGRYRSHWSQHRARKKATGELQPARHEVADADSGAVLESKLLRTGKFIEQVTGMDFGRFTRSMLLAQGDFAAFLDASPDDRAPILEQITGTEIYSQISMKVHERRRKERDALELLMAELKGIEILGEAEVTALKERLQELQANEKTFDGKLKALRKAENWLEKIAGLEKKSVEIDKELAANGKRLEAFEPERQRLEKAQSAFHLEGVYKGVTVLRSQQQAELKELDDTGRRLPEKEKALAGLKESKEMAEKQLREERVRQQSEAVTIKKVRELDTRLSDQMQQLESKRRAISDAETQAAAYQKEIDAVAGQLEKSKEAISAADEYLTRHAADVALVTDLAVIEKGFETIRACEEKQAAKSVDLAKSLRNKEDAVEQSEKLAVDHGNATKEFEKEEQRVKTLAGEIETLLKGQDIGQLRARLESGRERERYLLAGRDIAGRVEKATAALDGLQKEAGKQKAESERLAKEIASTRDQKEVISKELAALETEVSLRSRIRDLEDERKRLEDGRECPLCGATEHPFARGNVPELDDAETRLEKKKEALNGARETLRKLDAEQVRAIEAIRHAEKAIVEKKAVLAEDEKALADTLAKLEMEAPIENLPAELDAEIAKIRVEIADIAGIVTVVEETSGLEKAARGTLEALRKKRDDLGVSLQAARHKLETAGGECDRLRKERDKALAETENAIAAALKDVQPFGITQVAAAELDTVYAKLSGRKQLWETRQAEKFSGEKSADKLQSEVGRLNALMEKHARDLKSAKEDYEHAERHCSELGKSRQDLFGDKDVDRVEKQLARAIETAEKALDASREAQVHVDKEIGKLTETVGLLKGKTEKRAAELVAAEESLQKQVAKEGFKDEAGFLAARLIEGDRQTLAEKEKRLNREKTELDARKADNAKALTGERSIALTDQPAESIKKDIEKGEADLKQIQNEIGGIEKSLSENEKMREKQAERIKLIAAQQAERARWDDLHQLIGSADGKKFRNFAQGLTFEVMTAHANRQLAQMTDRYLLVRDAARPLDLNVVDNWQAGEVRSTKNLSGGESFIVSLALALGLSRMASRNVRVDSLFLDEGFGTLDEEALETALVTLAGLQQEGKLIGVISHVAALKERIGTRIRVIPGTGGRSRIEGPGCQSV